MKKTISLAAIAAVFAIGAAFTTRQTAQWWNVNSPEQGSPGVYFLTDVQIKAAFCPGLNNIECAYPIANPINFVKKP